MNLRQLIIVPLCLVCTIAAIAAFMAWLIHDGRDVNTLIGKVRSSAGRERWHAVYELRRCLSDDAASDPHLSDNLLALFDEVTVSDPTTAACLARLLGTHVAPERAAPALARALSTPHNLLRIHAALALAHAGQPAVLPALEPLLADDDAGVRKAAAFAVGRLGTPEAAASLEPLLGDPDVAVRWNAALALASLGSEASSSLVRRLLDRSYLREVAESRKRQGRSAMSDEVVTHVMVNALRAAARLPATDLREPIALLSRKDPSPRVRQTAHRALAVIDGGVR
jgi:HEAT repeat protein